MSKKRVLVAMSGGVDSSVAAGLLGRAGYECVGVFMCLGQKRQVQPNQPGCCSPEDAADAREVARRLGMEFEVVDFQQDIELIIQHFVDEYRRGRTPNPCILCNSRLKFGKLADLADKRGAEYVATGHYARVADIDGRRRLVRGVDNGKDQSYSLFGMGVERLGRILLPVGEYHKGQIRELATEMDLPVHDKGESQEICFVPDDDYARLVAERTPDVCREGEIVNTSGKVLGKHEGTYKYTIGQRRGLGIALGEPAYVVQIDAEANRVVLGNRQELSGQKLRAENVVWMVDEVPNESFKAIIQIRYNHRGAAGVVRPIGDGTVEVEFDEPVSAITPGQAAVFYDKHEAVVGGGWIA